MNVQKLQRNFPNVFQVSIFKKFCIFFVGQFTKPQFPGEETHQPTIPPFEQRPGQTTPSRFERPKEQPSFPGKPTPFGQKPREEFTPQPTVPQFEQRPGQTTTSRFERPEFTTQPSRLETVPQPGFPGIIFE
jgi:hypothetical protein